MPAGRPGAQPGSFAASSDLPVAPSEPCGTTIARSLEFDARTPCKRMRFSHGLRPRRGRPLGPARAAWAAALQRSPTSHPAFER